MSDLQLHTLHPDFDRLHDIFGDKRLKSIYGAGCVKNPRVMFVFMNPTGRNVSANLCWHGLRAPWLGTKVIWKLFHELKLISDEKYFKIQKLKNVDWTPEFSESIYTQLRKNRVYTTNLAKCTQKDARPLSNVIFKEYLDLMLREIEIINPKHIITFGNQVSSIILGKNISVSTYQGRKSELLVFNKRIYNIYPVYYPVGQGMRNMSRAVNRIRRIIQPS
jgi:DNA polymerase